MGKKNKKSRRKDDDENEELLATHDNGSPPSRKKTSPNSGRTPSVSTITLDIMEETMISLLKNYPDKPDDWLYRTMEKNMKVGKGSLKRWVGKYEEDHGAEDVLGEMRLRLEEKLENEEEDEEHSEDGGVDDGERDAVETSNSIEDDKPLSMQQEAKIRAEARTMGLDPDEAVADALASMASKITDNEEGNENHSSKRQQLDANDEGQMDENASSSMAVSLLLALHPYLAENISSIQRIPCLVLYQILSIILLMLGSKAKQHAQQLWDTQYLPSIEATQLEEEKEEDEAMLKKNSHLWSENSRCWIAKDATYSSLASTDDGTKDPLPCTIRWNDSRKQWERWSKNLTTRTKAMKNTKNSDNSEEVTLIKGTFMAARPGEGWASAPNKPEVENTKLADGDVRFLVCLPVVGNENRQSEKKGLEVVDVTSWVTKSLFSMETARALQAVDSGRALFTMDVSMLAAESQGKSGKGIKGSKERSGKNKSGNRKSSSSKNRHHVEDEAEGVLDPDYILRKGIGVNAQVCSRYLDQLQ